MCLKSLQTVGPDCSCGESIVGGRVPVTSFIRWLLPLTSTRKRAFRNSQLITNSPDDDKYLLWKFHRQLRTGSFPTKSQRTATQHQLGSRPFLREHNSAHTNVWSNTILTMQFLIPFIILLSPPARGINILFFPGDGLCDTSKQDYLICSDLPEYKCCQSRKPFRVTSILANISGSTDHYVMGEGWCDENGNYTTVRDSTGLSNCIQIPASDASDLCSSFWEYTTNHTGHTGVLGVRDHKMGCQEPDKMVYRDGTAIRHIHLPNGTFQDAMKYYQDKDYGQLAAFPAWDGSNVNG